MPPKKEKQPHNSFQLSKKNLEEQLLEEYPEIVERDPNNSKKYRCKPCFEQNSKFCTGDWYNFGSHLLTSSHQSNCAKAEPLYQENEDNDEEAFQEEEENLVSLNISDQVLAKKPYSPQDTLTSELELYLDSEFTNFILQRRLPFSVITHLVSFVKTIANSCKPSLLDQYNCSRKKVVKIINQAADNLKSEIFDQLRSSPFSISIDESSDLYGHSYLAVCVRLLEDANYSKLTSKLISIIPVTDSSEGETLYDKLKKEILIDAHIERNLMGIVTDEGPNMAGKYSGVSARLCKDYPYAINALDLSHLYHTIFKKSLKGFPDKVLDIINGISKHFAYSTQRKALLKKMQISRGSQQLGVLHYVETRWLSMEQSLERILEIWDILASYFEKYGTQKEKLYFIPENQVYLHILYSLAYKLNACNLFFQKDNLFYDGVVEKIKSSFVIFANMVLSPETRSLKFEAQLALPFEKMTNKDFVEGKFHLEIHEILGNDQEFEEQITTSQSEKVKKLFEECGSDRKKEILSAARKFILLSLKYMKTKLPYQNEIMNDIQVIFLKEFDRDKRLRLQNRFNNIISSEKMRNAFINELENLQYNFDDISSAVKMRRVSPLETWKTLEEDYPTLCILARALFVLPCSTVDVERIFSSLKNIKNSKRNRLTVNNLEACLLTYQNLSRKPSFTQSQAQKPFNPKEIKKYSDMMVPSQSEEKVSETPEASIYESDFDELGLSTLQYIARIDNPLKRMPNCHKLGGQETKKVKNK